MSFACVLPYAAMADNSLTWSVYSSSEGGSLLLDSVSPIHYFSDMSPIPFQGDANNEGGECVWPAIKDTTVHDHPATTVYIIGEFADIEEFDSSRPNKFYKYSTYNSYNDDGTTGIICSTTGTDYQFRVADLFGKHFSATFNGRENAFTVTLCDTFATLSCLTARRIPCDIMQVEQVTVFPRLVPVYTDEHHSDGKSHLFEFAEFDDSFHPALAGGHLYLFIGSTATVFETMEPITLFESAGQGKDGSTAVAHVGTHRRIVFNDMYEIPTKDDLIVEVGDFEVVYEDDAEIPDSINLYINLSGHGVDMLERKSLHPGLVSAHWRSVFGSGRLVGVA